MVFKDKRINYSIFGLLGVFDCFGVGFLFSFFTVDSKKLFNMGLEKYTLCSVTGKYQGLSLDCLDCELNNTFSIAIERESGVPEECKGAGNVDTRKWLMLSKANFL